MKPARLDILDESPNRAKPSHCQALTHQALRTLRENEHFDKLPDGDEFKTLFETAMARFKAVLKVVKKTGKDVTEAMANLPKTKNSESILESKDCENFRQLRQSLETQSEKDGFSVLGKSWLVWVRRNRGR